MTLSKQKKQQSWTQAPPCQLNIRVTIPLVEKHTKLSVGSDRMGDVHISRFTENRERYREICRRIADGESEKALAKEYGLSIRTIRDIYSMRKYLRSNIHSPHETRHRDRIICERRLSGESEDDLAREFNLAPRTIHTICYFGGVYRSRSQ